MGTFNIRVDVGHPSGGDMESVEAMVDTGASDSVFPASLLTWLHIEQEGQITCEYANGEQEELSYGAALIRIGERSNVCPVVFGAEGQFLVGATTLEFFKLAVDPVRQELIPTRGLRLGWGGRL